MSRSAVVEARLASILSRTGFAIGAAFRRRDGRAVFAFTTLAYLAIYLFAIGHLTPGRGGIDLIVAADPVSKLFQPSSGPLSFEPVALIRLGPVTYLASFTTVIGLLIGGLVGINVSVSYLAWRQPTACGLAGPSAGVLAGVPALLSGAACCGPVILIILGVQVSSALLAVFDVLVPIAIVLLLGSMLLVGRQVDPAAVN